eukprot:6149144-Pleurochrysis_carterae.AAC.1
MYVRHQSITRADVKLFHVQTFTVGKLLYITPASLASLAAAYCPQLPPAPSPLPLSQQGIGVAAVSTSSNGARASKRHKASNVRPAPKRSAKEKKAMKDSSNEDELSSISSREDDSDNDTEGKGKDGSD